MASSSPPTTSPKITRIAVLLLPPVQFLDIAGIDLFSMLTRDYLKACKLPAPLIAGAVPIEITYVSEAGPSTTAELTASAGLRIDANFTDKMAAPGKIDILLIPGPDPSAVTSEAAKGFIRAHAEKGTNVLTVCTGIYPAAEAGILEGKKATAPRALIGEFRKKFPGTEWVDRRWSRDGNVWCSGGITNGLDMIAAFIREMWPGPTAEAALAIADVGERGEEYGSSKASENAWWVWQILRAWVNGPKR